MQQQALFNYQKAIQAAFQETEDALVGQVKSRERADAQGQQAQALRSYAQLARARYEGGYSSYLEVLDAERSLFNAELQYTQAQANVLAQMIGLYKALGGGWVDAAVASADAASAPAARP